MILYPKSRGIHIQNDAEYFLRPPVKYLTTLLNNRFFKIVDEDTDRRNIIATIREREHATRNFISQLKRKYGDEFLQRMVKVPN